MKDDSHSRDAPLSPARQAWLMLVVIAPMAACYPAIKTGLEFAPSLRIASLPISARSMEMSHCSRTATLEASSLPAGWVCPSSKPSPFSSAPDPDANDGDRCGLKRRAIDRWENEGGEIRTSRFRRQIAFPALGQRAPLEQKEKRDAGGMTDPVWICGRGSPHSASARPSSWLPWSTGNAAPSAASGNQT